MPSREPSVSSLADALARTSGPPPEPRVAIARPRNLVRVLVSAVLVLVLLFVAALLVLGARVSALLVAMREDQTAITFRERQALPAESVLRDPEATRRETLARPLAAGVIWRARCELLAGQGDWAGIEETCTRIGLTSPGDLLPATRLLQAEALHRLGRGADAARLLHAIDQAGLDEAGRARAADLAGRLWLSSSRPTASPASPVSVEGAGEQVGQPASESADQPDHR